MQIEYIVNCPEDNLELAKDYIITTFGNDERMLDNFLQIIKIIESQFSSFDNKLVNKDGTKFRQPYEITLRNALGVAQRAEIIKKLYKHDLSYEIRIDKTYEHFRLIFFVNDMIAKCVFTFGFTKVDLKPESDQTDFCAFHTEKIAQDFVLGHSEKWLNP
ncbi:hypothetical protein [Enterococcus innesii]|uniref:hypothetical protein n=1 Tax=Enterococcus TaxID=1350 RepID=UPI001C449AF5|nr:hypothetical protein [Enterococcus casseliflavus]